MLREHAFSRPEHPALISAEHVAISYRELWERAAAAASCLEARGVRAGDRVILSAESSPDFAIAYFAVHLARGVAVPVDASAPGPRLIDLVHRTTPRLVVSSQDWAGRLELPVSSIPLGEIASLPPTGALSSLPELDDLADLLFTSGTSGQPKGVMLTHRAIAAAAAQINEVIGTGPEDVEVVPLPLNHSFGLTRLRCLVQRGGTLVICHGFRLPGEIFEAIARYEATGLVGVPAGFAILLRFGEEGLRLAGDRLRYVEIGSAPMTLENKLRLTELLPTTALWMHYGLTEASRSTFLEFHRHRDRLSSIGRPSPGVEFRIRSEQGQTTRLDQPGVLWLRGPALGAGYWGDATLTAERFVDGWVCTGDLATVDGDGFLSLHGRSDDMINVGGYNVAPEEVEIVLCRHPDILDAACVACSDPRNVGGSAVAAYLVVHPGHERPSGKELARWVSQQLEGYKVPARWEWTDRIPRTDSGKTMRSALRMALAEAEHGSL